MMFSYFILFYHIKNIIRALVQNINQTIVKKNSCKTLVMVYMIHQMTLLLPKTLKYLQQTGLQVHQDSIYIFLLHGMMQSNCCSAEEDKFFILYIRHNMIKLQVAPSPSCCFDNGQVKTVRCNIVGFQVTTSRPIFLNYTLNFSAYNDCIPDVQQLFTQLL